MRRLSTLAGQYVVIPLLGLVLRVLTFFLGGPRVGGMKFVSCVGDTEELRPRVDEALRLVRQADPAGTAPAWKAWQTVMVRSLPPGKGAMWIPEARLLELSERVCRNGTPLEIAWTIAGQAKIVSLWEPASSSEESKARDLEESKTYADWVVGRLTETTPSQVAS